MCVCVWMEERACLSGSIFVLVIPITFAVVVLALFDYMYSLSVLVSSLHAVSRPPGRWSKERLGPRLPGLGGDPYSPLGELRRAAVRSRNVLDNYELAPPDKKGITSRHAWEDQPRAIRP